MTPLLVEVEGEATYATRVGQHSKTYPLTFNNLMQLIRNRQGHMPKLLEYRAR